MFEARMRATFSIFFSLLLCLSQTALPGCPSPVKRVCSHCACPRGQDCCYEQASRGSQSVPIAPVRQVSSEQLQLALLQYASALTATTPATSNVHFADFSCSPSTAVPLYYRNCSLLI